MIRGNVCSQHANQIQGPCRWNFSQPQWRQSEDQDPLRRKIAESQRDARVVGSGLPSKPAEPRARRASAFVRHATPRATTLPKLQGGRKIQEGPRSIGAPEGFLRLLRRSPGGLPARGAVVRREASRADGGLHFHAVAVCCETARADVGFDLHPTKVAESPGLGKTKRPIARRSFRHPPVSGCPGPRVARNISYARRKRASASRARP